MAVLPEFLQFVDPNSGVIHRLTFFGESFEEIFDMMHCNMIFDTTWWSRVIFYCPMVSHGVPWPRNAFPSLGCRWPGFQQRCVGSPNLWRRQPRRFHWVAGNLAVTGGKPGRVRWCDAQHISFEISGIFRSYQFCRFSRFCRFCLSMFSFRRWFLSCFRHSAAHFRPTNEHRPHTAHIGVGVVPLINFCCRVKTVTSCANPLVAFQSPFFFSL